MGTNDEGGSKENAPPFNLKYLLLSASGRNNRGTFWAISIALTLLSLVLHFISMAIIQAGGGIHLAIVLPSLLFPFVIWANFANWIKRWHDLNMSGWLALTLLIPFINSLVFLYIGIAPGSAGTNRYGEPPQKP